MAQIAIQQTILNDVVNREMQYLHPTALFRLCQTDHSLYGTCRDYRYAIWKKYFEEDILPFLYDASKHPSIFPNYAVDIAFRAKWTSMELALTTNADSVSNAQVYELYQEGIRILISTAWYLSQKLRPAFLPAGPIQESWLVSSGFQNLPNQAAAIHELIRFATARMQNLCRLKKRLHLELTSNVSSTNPNVLLNIQARQILRFSEFAVWSANTSLLSDIIAAWPTWFYMIADDGTQKVDLLYRLVETIADTIGKKEISEEQGKELARTFARLFVIPTVINPRGRFSETFSDQVRQMLVPVKNAQNEYQDIWHQAVESIWIDELNSKF